MIADRCVQVLYHIKNLNFHYTFLLYLFFYLFYDILALITLLKRIEAYAAKNINFFSKGNCLIYFCHSGNFIYVYCTSKRQVFLLYWFSDAQSSVLFNVNCRRPEWNWIIWLSCRKNIVQSQQHQIYHRIACFVMFFLFNDYHKWCRINYFCAPCNHYSKKNVRKAKELLDFKNGCYADNCRKTRQYADSHRKSPKSLFICQSQYVCISTHPTHAALFYCSLGAASCVDTDCCA